VQYGEFPHPGLCKRIFGTDLKRSYGPLAPESAEGESELTSFLKDKRLIFPRDERVSFSFDMVTLRDRDGLKDLKYHIKRIEEFARHLRVEGGFFFFRESYGHISSCNKIYNGAETFFCADGMKEALPQLLRNRARISARNLQGS
jgi:hypothetical protein